MVYKLGADAHLLSAMKTSRRSFLQLGCSLAVCVLILTGALYFFTGDTEPYGLQPGDTLYGVQREGKPSAASHVHGLPFADSWGSYSPYAAQATYTVPDGCTVEMANILQRHGTRNPTSGAKKRIMKAVNKLRAVPSWDDDRYQFIAKYKYKLRTESLLPHGARQSFESGAEAAKRYKHLGEPFVRSSDSERVNDSAGNWTLGYADVTREPPPAILQVSEKYNTTLDDSMCTNWRESKVKAEWATVMAPNIIRRLRGLAQPPTSLELDPLDVPNVMVLCAFETLSAVKRGKPEGKEPRSPWCELWTKAEVAQLEYYLDIEKFYNLGYGNELGPVQGVGYVAELLARLTQTEVGRWDQAGRTSVNHTLDSDPRTFPLDRQLYVDFSHDNQMIAILSALGVFRPPALLSTTEMDPARSWVMSVITPFSGRIVFEKLSCSHTHEPQVRILVNDKPAQLPEPCSTDGKMLCSVADFVESQKYVRGGAQEEWRKCRSVGKHTGL